MFSTYVTPPLLRRMFRPDYCNSYPTPGLKLLLTSVAPKIQTSSKRSYRKCWDFPRVKAIVSRWSFLSLQGKKRSKIRVHDNTYCCQIQVAFLDSPVSFTSSGSQNTREPARRLKGISKKCILKGRKLSTYLHLFCIKFPTFSYNCFAYYCDTDFLSFC